MSYVTQLYYHVLVNLGSLQISRAYVSIIATFIKIFSGMQAVDDNYFISKKN